MAKELLGVSSGKSIMNRLLLRYSMSSSSIKPSITDNLLPLLHSL
jgi:hypothetical protein